MDGSSNIITTGKPGMERQAISSGDASSPASNIKSSVSLNSGVLDSKMEEAKAMLAEVELEKKTLEKSTGEIGQRLDDVATILKQIQLKEEKLDVTHTAIDVRMDNMDRMLGQLELEKQEIAQWKLELQQQQEVNGKQTEKLEHGQKALQKQSDMLAQLMRQQHQTKSNLDSREEKLEAREKTLALRELALKKGEITLVYREQGLKAYEQEVQKQINSYLQDENALQKRMDRMLNQSLETTLTNHSEDFSTPYVPGSETQVTNFSSPNRNLPSEHAYRLVGSRNSLISFT
jgi:chromosome segregation ATPase